MESDGGCLHTHAYMNLLSDGERASRPPWNKYQLKDGEPNREEWSDALRRKYGFAPPFDFRDQINGITTFHHLERLPCEEFPEEIGNE